MIWVSGRSRAGAAGAAEAGAAAAGGSNLPDLSGYAPRQLIEGQVQGGHSGQAFEQRGRQAARQRVVAEIQLLQVNQVA